MARPKPAPKNKQNNHTTLMSRAPPGRCKPRASPFRLGNHPTLAGHLVKSNGGAFMSLWMSRRLWQYASAPATCWITSRIHASLRPLSSFLFNCTMVSSAQMGKRTPGWQGVDHFLILKKNQRENKQKGTSGCLSILERASL